ncbi:MAG: hypothetical protein FOGNACKC_02238 [Anaerolineae bacterium]|nr:hypothetical protein [Anaerolineae bacterium]
MAKQIKWNGFGVRLIHGYVFRPGQVITVEDEQIALDILTQPGEPFSEVTPPAEPEPEPNPESSGEPAPAKRRK